MKELDFLKNTLENAYNLFCNNQVVVSEKAAFDVVTNIDKSIEHYFAQELEKAFPGDTLLGEEFSSDEALCGRTWILDPIDGTYNFSIGSRLFGLQGAFWENGELLASVIYLPKFGEIYTAQKGGGAHLGDKKLSVSNRSVQNSIVSFGDLPHPRPEDAYDQGKMMQKAYEKIARLRMYGAACLDFANLASGKTEGVVLFTKNKWDLAPGMLLAKEAGAKLYDVYGNDYDFSARGILACHSKEIMKVLKLD